jgi:hypothetical protein
MNPKKIHVRLAGGLGNQLFQWSAGYAMARSSNGELVLDRISGFKTDFKYHRQYELGELALEGTSATPWGIAQFWTLWLADQFGVRPESKDFACYFERPNVFMESVLNHSEGLGAFLSGYFQSPKYFRGLNDEIRQKLAPPTPNYWVYRALGEQMQSTPSLALGIRLYEETKDPAYHAHQGQLLNVLDVQRALDTMASELGELSVYVFCTHHSAVLDQLRYPGPVKFISADEGYSDTWGGLWLLSQCRHHLISNSSFYWWGAFLSESNYAQNEQVFMASRNFSNQEIYLPYWRQF